MKRFFTFAFFILTVSLATSAYAQRFFYHGDGSFTLKNIHTGQTFQAHYLNAQGEFDPQVLQKLNQLFGVPAQRIDEGVSLRLISLIDYMEDHYAKGKVIEMNSAYRSPKYNELLREKGRTAGKTSYHLYAMAADLHFPGANHKQIWEDIRHLDYCGIGYYSGKTIHVDSGKPRFWTTETALPKGSEKPLNKNIYLSSEYDTYQPGETMRLFLSAISDFPFGIQTKMVVKNDDKKLLTIKPLFNSKKAEDKCLKVTNLKEARHITWEIPNKSSKLPFNQDLTIELSFCNPVYENMAQSIESRKFQITQTK